MGILLATILWIAALPVAVFGQCLGDGCADTSCTMHRAPKASAGPVEVPSAPKEMRADHSCCAKQPVTAVSAKTVPVSAEVSNSNSAKPGDACRCLLRESGDTNPAPVIGATWVTPTSQPAATLPPALPKPTVFVFLVRPGHYAGDSGPPNLLSHSRAHPRAPPATW